MPRMTMITRGIVLVAVCAAAVTACTPPLPPDVLAAQAENTIVCQSGSQNVSMPDDFAGAMSLVNGNLSGVCVDQSITEVLPGEPATLQVIDHAPTTDDIAAFKQNCPTNPIVVPAFGYAVGLAYNIIGLDGLVLTPEVIAGMLSGAITSWEDPKIAEANAGIDLTGLPPIAIAALDAPSGAVEAMTTWLSKAAPKDWTSGPTATLANATTTFPTAIDLMGELTAMEGTIAVVPVVSAATNAVPVASLPVQDLVIAPDDTQSQKIGLGATTITKDEAGNLLASPAVGGVPVEGNLDLAASKVVLAEGQPVLGWPVMGVAHLVVCDDPKDPLPLSTAQYVVRLAGQGGFETFGVTPLPEPIRIQTFAPLKVTVAPPSSS